MSSRYEARTDGNRVIVIDGVGHNSKVVEFTPEQDDALFARISDFFNAGVERYGSVDEFTRALRWHNDLKAA